MNVIMQHKSRVHQSIVSESAKHYISYNLIYLEYINYREKQ